MDTLYGYSNAKSRNLLERNNIKYNVGINEIGVRVIYITKEDAIKILTGQIK